VSAHRLGPGSPRRRPSHAALATLTAILAFACAGPAAPPPDGAPRLVVLIVVDQMRGDYVDRFDRFWQGGFRLLRDRGVEFTDAHHDHAVTQTAPGHSTLVTGCHPRRHGVPSNYWIDRRTGEEIYSGEDDDGVVSPERLECSTIGDWLKARYPTARVFSIAGKDRSAVLEAGREADGVFFYDDETGGWKTSTYYYRKPPAWLDEFNDERWLDGRFGEPWEPLPAAPEDLAAVGLVPFDLGPLEPDLPIAFGGLEPAPGSAFYGDLFASPWMDESMARLAEQLVGAEALGGDEVPDFLALGFSAADAVGHDYGPDSPQLLDTLRRLDATLAGLFRFLDRRIGLDHVVLALSSDHGAVPVPEVRQAAGLSGRRADTADVLCMQRVYARLQGRFGAGAWLLDGPFVNRDLARRKGVQPDDVERAAADLMAECPAVVKAWTRSELLADGIEADPVGRLFAHSFNPERSPDFLVQYEEYFLGSRGVASSHGTAWSYDTHVPLLIAGPGVERGVRSDRVRTVDLAPTLAALAGAPALGEIDGADLLAGSATP
jgi:arylsulfatase A-like enzyme